MRIGWIALGLAVASGALRWVTSDYERAERYLSEYYSRMLSADFVAAEASIDAAIGLWPENARYHVWKGYCLSQRLPPQCSQSPVLAERAREEFRAAVKLNGRDAVAHHDLAWLEHLAGNAAEARAEWKRAVEIDPDNTVFRLSLGMFLDEAGETAEAMNQYNAAVQISPAALDSPFFARHAALAKRVAEYCTKETERRLANGKDPVLMARLGKLYLYLGDAPKAAEALTEAANALPNLPLVWFNLGEFRRLQGENAEAIANYKRAVFLDAKLAGPHLRLGELESSRKGIDELRLAVQAWSRVNPVTASHNNRLFRSGFKTNPQKIDDLLPTTLVWYLGPCEASRAYRGLSKAFPNNRLYAAKTHTCEEIPAPHRTMASDFGY